MKFILRPILKEMRDLYRIPPSRERFDSYLFLLQGNSKDDMKTPVAGYNPMGKEVVTDKLDALIQMNAEGLAALEIEAFNSINVDKDKSVFEVVLNLADDLGGAWSHRFMTDYSTKFQIAPLLKRRFCTPYFWTSEEHDEQSIKERIRAYLYRTSFQIKKGVPKSLKDHIQQEVYVSRKVGIKNQRPSLDAIKESYTFYIENADSEDYGLIFNFLYGDEVSESLGYKEYGCDEGAGMQLIKHLALD